MVLWLRGEESQVSHKQCRQVDKCCFYLRLKTEKLKSELLKLKTADFTGLIPSLTQVWEVRLVNPAEMNLLNRKKEL